MSPIAIKEQLQTLDLAFAKATQSKEAAKAFLMSAGLMPIEKENFVKQGKPEKSENRN